MIDMVDVLTNASVNSRNGLLAALESSDFALLQLHLRHLPLIAGTVLQEEEAPVEQIYFPLSGLISLVAVMEAGEVVETATVGRRGAVGAFAGLGRWHAFTRAVVQIPGTAMVISASHFQAAVSQSERIRDLILRYKEGLLAQVQQTAACNALHQVEARLAAPPGPCRAELLFHLRARAMPMDFCHPDRKPTSVFATVCERWI
jgi:CRP-like cAMP-binding protein